MGASCPAVMMSRFLFLAQTSNSIWKRHNREERAWELKQKFLGEKKKEMKGYVTREDVNLNDHGSLLTSPNH